MHLSERVILDVSFVSELKWVFPLLCPQAPRCQRPEDAEEKTNKIWKPEVWDEARFDRNSRPSLS